MGGRTNRIIMAAMVVCASCAGRAPAEEKNVTGTTADAVSWLEKESHRIIRASKHEMKDGTYHTILQSLPSRWTGPKVQPALYARRLPHVLEVSQLNPQKTASVFGGLPFLR